MLLRKFSQNLQITIAMIVSVFSTGLMQPAVAYATPSATPPGQENNPGQDTCPATDFSEEEGGWIKYDGLSSLTYPVPQEDGFTVTDICYKAASGDLQYPEISTTVSSTVVNPANNNYHNLSHVSVYYSVITDECPNLLDIQTSVPTNMVKDANGDCVTPANPCEANYFPVQQMWEITWGHQFSDEGSLPTFTMDSNGGLTSLNGGAVPSYMTDAADWHWLYVTVDNVQNGRTVTYGFADGTVRTAVVSADQNNCPSVVWTETEPTPQYYLATSHSTVCGEMTISLRNVSPWVYPVSYSTDGSTPNASGPKYGPVVDNRGDAPDDQTGTKTLTFTEDQNGGEVTVKYVVAAGSESDLYMNLPVGQVTTVVVDTDCEDPEAVKDRANYNLTSMCKLSTSEGQFRIRNQSEIAETYSLVKVGSATELTGSVAAGEDKLVTVAWTSSSDTWKLTIAGFQYTKAIGNNALCQPEESDKVTLCHATGSMTNPYVKITVSAAGAFNGHLDDNHGGTHGDHQNGEDIIPEFTYKGMTYSQNWNAETGLPDNCDDAPTVTPAAVQFLNPTCENPNGRVVITATDHVTYKIGSSVVTGTSSYPAGTTVTVTAEIEEGYTLTGGVVASWSHTFTAVPENCVLGDNDVCPNIEGSQTVVPAGMMQNTTTGECFTPGGRGGVGPAQILGAATALPETLPSTGGADSPLAIIIASILAYGAAYFLQGRRLLGRKEALSA